MKFQTKTNFRVFALVVILTFFIVMSYILCKQTLDENSINADITESKWEYYCSAPSDSRSLTTTMSFDYKVSGESSLDLIQESDSRSFLLPVANISTVEEAHEYSYSFNGKYDNTKYTGRYDTSENNDTGSQRDLCIGNSVTTLSSTDIKLTQIVTYEFSLEFSDEMKAAVQNKRVEFAVNSLLINDIYMGATEYNLRGDLKTGNFTSQVKSSTFNVDLYYNSSVKMYSSPADPWKSPDRGKTGDKEKIEYAPSISSKIWFTPSANSKLDLTLTLTLAGEQSAWVQWGNYFVINSAPKIEIGVRYKTSDIAFKTETNDATAGYIDTFLGGSSDHDQTGANITYKVGIDSAYGESFIKAKAVANPGYCFLFWQPAKGTTFTNHDAYKPEVVPIALYNHPYSEVVDGKLTYVAVFEEIKYTDLSADHNLSYSYNGVGQGPRAYLTYNFPFTHQAQHMYSSISGNYWDNATNQTSSATLILNKPVVVDEYNYTITFARTIDDTYFLVGKKEDVQYEINKYKPSGSITENGVSLKTYYFGQTISSDYIQSQLEDGQSYLSDNYVLGSNNVPLGKLLGSYKFENSEYNNFMSENIRLVSNAAAQKIIFTPNDSNNIDPITLTGSVTITVTKTTLRIGYFYNGTFSEGLNSVELNTLTYGQNRIQLGVETKLVLYNPYIAEDELQSELQSMNDSKFAYAPFSVTDWGIITQRPAATEKPTEATLQLSLSGNIPNTSTSFSSVYNLPNEQIIIKYNVVKASLVFGGEENKKLTFKYNNYLGALSTVYSNIILMYGQGLKSVDITSTGTIGSNVEGYIDSGEIRFSWYKQNEGGAFLDENLADYYEQNFLTVLDSTNPNGTTKNYYCIKADWMKVGGDAENPNYESLIFYNQSITIEKAKLNSGVQFQQSTEVDSENPVVKSIIYGQNVANALSTNINVGTTLNVVNQDLEVYYKIEWIIDNGGNSIATLSNYPYALVENSGQYAVKVTILKWNGLSYVTDSDNYEQNGVFTRNETGGAFAFALLSVTRATQNFYLKIDNNLVELNNMNLVSSMIAINDNVYEEKTENLVINGDTDIDLETLYIKDNNTIKIVLYTSAVMYKQSETLNISAKAVATVSAHYPNIYSVTSEPVSNYSIEYISGSPYTRIEFTILLAQKAATTFGVLSLKLGQYDSGYELNNPSGGNYFSKEWNPAQNNDPFTIFIKANKNPEGIKAENIYNPDDSTDVQLYSYKEFYGDPIKIEPLSTVPGVLSYPANDDYITIKEDMNTDNETYLITSITTGSYKLLYTAPGYVDINNPIAVTPYMPINQEIWIYFAKKQSTVNILINSKINTKYTYGELSPEVNYTTNGFVDGDFDEIKPLVKLYFLSDNSDYKSNVILNVNEYYIGAFIDSFSSVIEGFSLEDIAKAKDIAKRYNITFNPVKIEVDPKTVIITFTDSSQFTIDNEIKVFEIDYFDDKLLNANNYPYTYTFVGILEGEDLNEVIGDELTRPSVRAMNTSNPSEHYPISARPDAGTYEIKLYVPVNCPAVNYEFDIERAILRVKTRDATLNFDEVEQDYTSTSYTFVNNAKVSGIKGATSPTGSLIIKFLKTGTVVSENTEFLTSLQHAGVYDVYVSYLSGNLDNYNDTDKVFSEYITINRIDPIVTLPSHNSTYDGIQITYPYNIRGIAADYTLPGETLVCYSTNGSDYSESIPINAGEYYVKLSYTSAATDNYNTIVVTSDDAVITIEKASLSITSSKLASKLMKTYDAKYINELDDIIVAGAPADGTISNEYLDIYYQRTGATEWTLWSVSSTPIDVGNYDIRLDYRTSDNQNISHNYSITSVSYRNGAIIISQKPLESISVKNEFKITKGYNGIRSDIAVDSDHVIIEYGIESSDITPTTINYSDISIAYAKVTYDGDSYNIGAYSSLAPMDAGSYIVRLTYNSKGASNYANGEFSISEIKTDEELSSNVKIEIKKIKPTISYTTTKLPYNAQNQAFTRYSVKGIGNEKPKGAFTIYYQKFGTTDEWVTTTPKDIAKYNIKIEFKAASTENYTNAEAEYSGIFEIINGNLSVTLTFREDKYQGVPVDEAKPTILKPDGKPVDFTVVTIKYRLNGAEDPEWSIATPSASGWYDVLIEVEQDESLTYIRYSNVFERILRILNPEPEFIINSYSRIYNAASESLPLSYIMLDNSNNKDAVDSVYVSDLNSANGELTGVLTLKYSLDGSTWTSTAPINVGVYSVKIIYTEGSDDHFASCESSVFNAKYTITPKTIIIVPNSNQSKIYDAQPLTGEEIAFNFDGDNKPFEDAVVSGHLIVADGSKSVGSYKISQGSISYGPNYVISMHSVSVDFVITKREITPTFEDTSYVYDGSAKLPEIYINKNELAGSEVDSDVKLLKNIEGNNVNSGEFIVTISISSASNYKLHVDFIATKKYEIKKAYMTENTFGLAPGDVKEIGYDGESHELTLASKEAGASVVYYHVVQSGDSFTHEPATTYVEVGEYLIEAVVTKSNYHEDILTAKLVITKGKLNVVPIPPTEKLYYGNGLPVISTLAKGSISLDAGQILEPGTKLYKWTFTPDDEVHYSIDRGQVLLTVDKAPTDVKIDGNLEQTEGSFESLEIKVYIGDMEYIVKPRVLYRSVDGVEYDSMPTSAGTYTMVIKVEGDEYISGQVIERELIIKPKPIIWPYIVGGILLLLFLLIMTLLSLKKRSSLR